MPFAHLNTWSVWFCSSVICRVYTRVCVLTWATLLCVPGPAANITTLPAWRSLLRTPGVRAHSWVPHTPCLGGVLLCFCFFSFFSADLQLPVTFQLWGSVAFTTSEHPSSPRVSALLPVGAGSAPAPSPVQAPRGPFWPCRASSHIAASLYSYIRFCAERHSLAGGRTLIIFSPVLGLPGPLHSCVCFGISSSVSINNQVSNFYWNCIAPVAPVVKN